MTASLIEGVFHRFLGEEVSWVGECPWTGSPCFGTDRGLLIIPGVPEGMWQIGPIADEALNGAAFSHDLAGMSTRENVVIWDRNDRKGNPFDGGAHQVVATAEGGFIAPLGPGGLLVVTPGPNRTLSFKTGQLADGRLNFSKVANLGESGSGEVFACAIRKSGFLTFSLGRDGTWRQPLGHSFPGLDLIDVCSLRSEAWPLAAAALDIDGTLLLTRNALSDRPKALQLEGLSGKAYSLSSARGHLFLTTSRSTVILPALASRFLDDEPLDRPIEMRRLDIRSIDAFVVYNELFFILPHEALSFEIDLLAGAGGLATPASPGYSFSVPSGPIETFWESRTPKFHDAPWESPLALDLAAEAVS